MCSVSIDLGSQVSIDLDAVAGHAEGGVLREDGSESRRSCAGRRRPGVRCAPGAEWSWRRYPHPIQASRAVHFQAAAEKLSMASHSPFQLATYQGLWPIFGSAPQIAMGPPLGPGSVPLRARQRVVGQPLTGSDAGSAPGAVEGIETLPVTQSPESLATTCYEEKILVALPCRSGPPTARCIFHPAVT
jgi:hypothetical protein